MRKRMKKLIAAAAAIAMIGSMGPAAMSADFEESDAEAANVNSEDANLHFVKSGGTDSPTADSDDADFQSTEPEDDLFVFTTQLGEDQLKNLASVQLVVLEKMDEASYSNVYATSDVSVDENGTLSAKYTGRTLYITDPEGNPVRGPLPWDVQNGYYEIPANYINDETGERTHVRYQCALDEQADRLEIKDLYVYDDLTGTFSDQTEFHPEDYTKVIFLDTIRKETYDGDTLLPFSDWEVDDNIKRGWESDISEEWEFRFFDELQTDSDLYVSFQVTDTQKNSFSSEPIKMENRNIREIAVTPDVIETEDCRIRLAGRLNNSRINPDFTLKLEITNLSDSAIRCGFVNNALIINDSHSVDSSCPIYDLGPDQTDSCEIKFDPFQLANLQELISIAGVVEISESDDYSSDPAQIPLSAKLDADVSSFAEMYDIANPLAETEKDGIVYQLLKLSEENDGSLTGVLRCINQTDDYISKYFPYMAVEGFRLDAGCSINAERNCETCLNFSVKNEFCLSEIFDSADGYDHLYSHNPLARWGLDQISVVSLLGSDLYWGIPDRIDLSLKETFEYTPSTLREETAPEMICLYEKDGVSVYCETFWVIDDKVSLKLELHNDTATDKILEFPTPRINGSPASAGFYEELDLQGGTTACACVCISPEEDSDAAQEALSSLSLILKISEVREDGERDLLNWEQVELQMKEKIPFNQKGGVFVPVAEL